MVSLPPLPPDPLLLAGVATFVGLAVGGYALYRLRKTSPTPIEAPEDEPETEADDELLPEAELLDDDLVREVHEQNAAEHAAEWGEGDDRPRGAAMADDMAGAERRGYLAGYRLGSSLVVPIARALNAVITLLLGLLMSLMRLLPKSESIYEDLMETGLEGMYNSATGKPDAIGIVHRESGELDFKPVKWKRSSPDDPTEPDRWVTKDGETWHAGTEGRLTERIGRTPVALFDEDAESKGSFLQSRFQAALDLGHKQALFVPEKVEQVIVEVNPEAVEEGGPEAVADGGAVESQVTYSIPDAEWPDKLADVLVDLSTPNADGCRVSAKSYKEVFQEKVGTEEMQMQELRGRAAEADPNAARDLMFKVFKWVAILVALSHAPELLGMLLGTGVGDSLSGLNPFAVIPYLPWVVV